MVLKLLLKFLLFLLFPNYFSLKILIFGGQSAGRRK
jgi:membrane-associated phospholipid phosphatase